MKRPAKIKLDVVKIPSTLHFMDTLGQRGVSIYVEKLTQALNQGGAVQIAQDDSYMKHQLRQAAKKLNLRLVYAVDSGFLYIKPLQVEGEEKRLMLLLREPRTVAELQSKKLELHLENSLSGMAKRGLAHINKDKWVLTAQGMDAL